MRTAQSSHLQRYSYDGDSQTLIVEFQNGSQYAYQNVPLTEFHNMSQSGGAGTYFWAKIRDRYPTTKIVDPRGAHER